jgi:hypothetical protein
MAYVDSEFLTNAMLNHKWGGKRGTINRYKETIDRGTTTTWGAGFVYILKAAMFTKSEPTCDFNGWFGADKRGWVWV